MRNQSLELPRETLEESARVELGRHRASPRHDGADDAAQDLSFRHAVIIRPHSKRCRTRGAPPTMKTCVTTAPTITPASVSAPNPLVRGIKSRNAFTIFPVEPEADCVPSVHICSFTWKTIPFSAAQATVSARSCCGTGPSRRPPSAMNSEPVEKLASSEATNSTIRVISSGSAMRGIADLRCMIGEYRRANGTGVNRVDADVVAPE